MTHRTLEAIQKDIECAQKELGNLSKELDAIRADCPHPDSFITYTFKKGKSNGCAGIAPYDFVTVVANCHLCTGTGVAVVEPDTPAENCEKEAKKDIK